MDPRLERLDQVIARATAGTLRAPDGSEYSVFPIAIHPREGEVLGNWVARERPAASIEVGLGFGISTLFILRGLLSGGSPSFRHLAVDPHQTEGFSGMGLQLVREAGLGDRLEFYEERSEILLPRLLAQGREFDFAFVDGNHRFDGVFVDLISLGRLLRGGSVIFLDDYQLPSVKKAVAFCTRDLGWLTEETGAADDKHHWVVLRTPETPAPRAFDHFVDF